MARPDLKTEILPSLVLVGFGVYLFREVIVGGHLLFGLDFNAFYLGMKQFLFDEVHAHGSIPYWNPYLFSGIPFWAHFESAIFYPLGFLFWVLPAAKAYGYTAFLHLVLAGVFMYSLGRSLGLSRFGGLVAGLVFTCNGYIMAIAYLGHLSPLQSYVWLPAIIFFLNRSLHARTPCRHAALAGALWGVQILAGAPQDAFYTFLASMLFLLCSWNQPSRGTPARLASSALLLFVVGAGLAAIQIIPGVEFINESVRSAVDSYEDVTRGSYPPQGIITAFLPHFFGDYARDIYWVRDIPLSVPQQSLYAGIVALFMTFFISLSRPAHRKTILFSLLLAALALVLSMGDNTPFYRLVYRLPGFDRFRAPSKILVLWVFAVGLLAGVGMSDLTSPSQKTTPRRMIPLTFLFLAGMLLYLGSLWNPSWIQNALAPFYHPATIPEKLGVAHQVIGDDLQRMTLIAAGIILIILLAARRSIGRKWAGCLLLGLLMLDLHGATEGSLQVNDGFQKKLESHRHSLARHLPKDGVYRVGSFIISDMGPNAEMMLGYQPVGGYTALFLNRYYEYINHYIENRSPGGWQVFTYRRGRYPAMMDLLNVEYELFLQGNGFITRRESSLPRAFLVPQGVVRGREEVLDSIASPGFDPKRTVFLERETPFRNTSSGIPPADGGKAEVVSYRPDDIRVQVSSETPAYLFMSEIYYPGWKAFIDKNPVEILRGNYLFRVIPIPEGKHIVDLQFRPMSIRAGIWISVATLLFTAVFALRPRKKRSSLALERTL